MREQELRQQVCDLGRNLWVKDMVAANDGNLSVRLDSERILCTPTGTSKGYLRPELLPVVALDGTVLGDCPLRPSSEIKMHLRVYADAPDAEAVVHAHPTFATLFAVRGFGLENRMLPETVVGLGPVPLAPYATPSTDAVPESIAPFIQDHSACLLQNHGALTWGPDLMGAYLAMERLESTAKLQWALELVGGGHNLPDAEIDNLRSLFGSRY